MNIKFQELEIISAKNKLKISYYDRKKEGIEENDIQINVKNNFFYFLFP